MKCVFAMNLTILYMVCPERGVVFTLALDLAGSSCGLVVFFSSATSKWFAVLLHLYFHYDVWLIIWGSDYSYLKH